MTHKLMTPTVHLNGTGREGLIKQYEDAWTALNKAVEALCNAAPHGRDYYVQNHSLGDAYTRARDEHDYRVKRVLEVQKEIEEIIGSLAEQV